MKAACKHFMVYRPLILGNKKAFCEEGNFMRSKLKLFQFGFFVDNVLAYNWIKFFDFQFARHVTFVFGSGVEVTSTS